MSKISWNSLFKAEKKYKNSNKSFLTPWCQWYLRCLLDTAEFFVYAKISVKSNHMRKYFSVWITSPDGLESWCPNISWHCPFKPENFLGAQSHSEPCHFITFLLLIEGQARTGLLSNLTWIKVNLSSNPAAYWPTAVLAPTCGQFPAQQSQVSTVEDKSCKE